ncbi:unnamed protein product [Cyclocybe aegerita]|uniref:Phosphatidic acid phosphatase type 2/haloperoxidase domain-containing protein n=1 Tax=Cyclocybe aegerita TaxID=1973307 RepID=A0A8S0VR88_CYCAE|nr:unnamed protein product [Cyclocybe aegerita]
MAFKYPITPSLNQKRLIFSYAPDWILTIVLGAIFLSLDKVDGFRRMFSLEDPSIRYPFAKHVRVPNVPLYLISILAPLCAMVITNFLTIRTWWDLHNSTLGLLLSHALTGTFTQVVKVTVGRPRPDFIDRCQPPAGLTDPPYGLTSWTVCTQTNPKILRDGFRSFFSGHSSSSFAGLGFLAFYLAGKLHLFDSRGHAGKAWLSLSPFMAAALVGISRAMDNRHHWHDIAVGSAIGTLFAYFSYRQYYPSLSSPVSHFPYSPRIKLDDDAAQTLPTHANDSTVYPFTYPFTARPSSSQGHDDSSGPGRYPHTNNTSGRFDVNDTTQIPGTVPRPGPNSLQAVWNEGGETVDRSRGMDHDSAYGGISESHNPRV